MRRRGKGAALSGLCTVPHGYLFAHQLLGSAPADRWRTGCIRCAAEYLSRRRGKGAPPRKWCGKPAEPEAVKTATTTTGRRHGTRCGQGRARTADLSLFRRTLLPTELPGRSGVRQGLQPQTARSRPRRSATQTGLEPATFAVTGRRANQLRHWALQCPATCSGTVRRFRRPRNYSVGSRRGKNRIGRHPHDGSGADQRLPQLVRRARRWAQGSPRQPRPGRVWTAPERRD